MTFIRIKKIKGIQYAYLIKNRWLKTKKQPKQKVVGYLGKLIIPDSMLEESSEQIPNPEVNFYDSMNIIEPEDYIDKNDVPDIIKDLVEFELKRHNMNGIEGLEIDSSKAKVMAKNKNVVLRLNDGYLCNYTMKRLVNFDFKGEEEEVGLELAKRFIGAGIAVPNEIFIGIFHKVFK